MEERAEEAPENQGRQCGPRTHVEVGHVTNVINERQKATGKPEDEKLPNVRPGGVDRYSQLVHRLWKEVHRFETSLTT